MRITIELTRPRRQLVLVLVAAILLLVPTVVVASHQFPDVPNSNPFHADIDALVDSEVTSGCGGGNYCPSANVTREQMAAFLNRLGALGAGKTPVVNADKLDGLDSTAFATDFGTTESPGLGAGMSYCYVGEVRLVAASYAYDTPADGRLLPIAGNETLYSLLGTLYGGNGSTTFALPDLRAVTPQSANGQPLIWSICTTGIFPMRD